MLEGVEAEQSGLRLLEVSCPSSRPGPGGRGRLPRVGSSNVNLFSLGAVLHPEGQEHTSPQRQVSALGRIPLQQTGAQKQKKNNV